MPNLSVEGIGGAGLGPLIPDDVLTPVAREAVPELFSRERQLASSERPHTRRPLSSHSSSSGAHTTLARREDSQAARLERASRREAQDTSTQRPVHLLADPMTLDAKAAATN